MAGARTMLARVRRLELARSPTSPFVLAYGSLEAWEAETMERVEAGVLDRTDMLGADGAGGVLGAIRRWHRDGVFAR